MGDLDNSQTHFFVTLPYTYIVLRSYLADNGECSSPFSVESHILRVGLGQKNPKTNK